MTYPIPAEALDDRLGIVGATGSGKTYTVMGMMEQLLGSGARVVAVDPLDVMYGLRLQPDGVKPSRFKLPIFGGKHGDLPLTEHSGRLIGETVAGMSESCIVSLGEFRSAAAERRFMLAFLDALYRNTHGSLFHLIFDEADLWAPQQVLDKEGDAMKLKGMVNTIVRRGRVKGVIPWLVTQRPAVIDKSVMSMMTGGLIAMALVSPQDREALAAWLKGQMAPDQLRTLVDGVTSLRTGEGVLWMPRRLVLERVKFPEKSTYDSSRTPKRGEAVIERTLEPLDLAALKDRLAKVEEETKANDPKALRAELAKLKADLAKAPAVAGEAALERVRQEGYHAGWAQGIAEGDRRGEVRGIAIGLARARTALDRLRVDEPVEGEAVPPKPPAPRAPAPVQGRPAPAPSPIPAAAPGPPAVTPEGAVGHAGVTGPQRAVLRSLAWWAAMGKPSPTRTQVAVICGWSPNSSNIRDRVSELARAGLVDRPSSGLVRLTEAGAAAAPPPDTGQTIAGSVRSILTGPQRQVFDHLLQAGEPLARDALAERIGWSPTSSNIRDRTSELARLGIIERPSPGVIALQDWLLE